ncbi:MAG: DUF2259 domain-containing protein [Pseudomonadota bacterium]
MISIREIRQALAACLLVLSTLLIAANAALAAQDTSLNVIGFSTDGTIFAFEEYKVQDGSGAPSSTVYVIDMATDTWLPDTPITIGGSETDGLSIENSPDPEAATAAFLKQYRDKAKARVAALFEARGGLREAITVAANPPTDFSNDAQKVRFHPVPYFSAIRQTPEQKMLQLSITETPFPASENCFSMFESMKGLTLTLIDERDGSVKNLNEDTRIPASRGCPQFYRIEKVVVPQPNRTNPDALAIILRYATVGFEGNDGRLMAITYQMPRKY